MRLAKMLTPATDLGLAAARGYAAHQGVSEEQFRQKLGAPVTPEKAGQAFVTLAAGDLNGAVAYALTGDGLSELPIAGSIVSPGLAPRAADLRR